LLQVRSPLPPLHWGLTGPPPTGHDSDTIVIGFCATGTSTLAPKQLETLQKFLNFEESVCRGLFEVGNRMVKALIKSSTSDGVQLPVTDGSPHLRNLCTLLHHMLAHGLKDKRTMWGTRKTSWDFVQENLEKRRPSAVTALTNARNMTTQAPQPRLTSLIKQSLMEMELANHIQALRGDEELLRLWYEPFAFFRDERSAILLGLMTALNSIEFNLYLKVDDSAAGPPPPQDLSLFAKGEMPGEIRVADDSRPRPTLAPAAAVVAAAATYVEGNGHGSGSASSPVTGSGPATPAGMVDASADDSSGSLAQEGSGDAGTAIRKAFQSMSQQNAYLEEMNKSLQAKYDQEKKTTQSMRSAEQKLRKDWEQGAEKVRSLEEKVTAMEVELKKVKESMQQQVQETRDDAIQEQKSFQNTKTELNNLYQKEKRLREQAEEAFDRAMMKHAEAESRVSLLEKQFEDAKLIFDNERCESNRGVTAAASRIFQQSLS